jgi:hypothetical protein
MLLYVGATLVGEPPDAESDTFNLHLAAPETPYRTHYWYWTTRNFAINFHANVEIRKLIEARSAKKTSRCLRPRRTESMSGSSGR